MQIQGNSTLPYVIRSILSALMLFNTLNLTAAYGSLQHQQQLVNICSVHHLKFNPGHHVEFHFYIKYINWLAYTIQ